jgi:hypothetical protein
VVELEAALREVVEERTTRRELLRDRRVGRVAVQAYRGSRF